ncbi:MAG: hypothetical protein HeimC2_45470 [Candidatus Heimdallarchaeota archaeon LC_2]|nr:MAG: hypothetical protein HeimC2_45470 [Candidatus Heimdallarchaeota archaeon LC_2]
MVEETGEFAEIHYNKKIGQVIIKGSEEFVEKMFDKLNQEGLLEWDLVNFTDEELVTPNATIQSIHEPKQTTDVEEAGTNDGGAINKIADSLQIPVDKFSDVLELIGEDIYFHGDIKGSKNEIVRQISFMILYITNVIGNGWVKSAFIADTVQKSNFDHVQISKALQSISSMITQKGKKNATEYKLNREGLDKAKGIMREYLK